MRSVDEMLLILKILSSDPLGYDQLKTEISLTGRLRMHMVSVFYTAVGKQVPVFDADVSRDNHFIRSGRCCS